MTAYPAWTPASRPGIIPLHPLTFGSILGRSFAALRQNPRVLLGFALVVQTLAYLIVLVAVGAVAWASFSRLDTLRPGTEEYDTVLAGSIAITAVAGIVLGLAAGALGVIVQGIVVVEVTHAALAEKLTLGALWRQVKPIAWRLVGYALLVTVAVVALVGLVVLGVVAIGMLVPFAAVALTILLILAAIPVTWWLMTKLLLVPATIIIEHATILEGLRRSWTLTRGRFWPILGVIVVISIIFGVVGQVISIPFSFLSMGLTTIITPTGDPEPSALIAVIITALGTQVLTLLLQSVAIVVQSTATAIIYIDCRMRREGLDLDLLAYVERRDAGVTGLSDPYRENVGRVMGPRGWAPGYAAGYGAAGYTAPGYAAPAAPTYGVPAAAPYAPHPGGPAASGYPGGRTVAGPGHPAPAQGYAPPTGYTAPGAPAPSAAAPAAAPPAAHEAPAAPTTEGAPAPTTWSAPGAPADGTDPDSPWR